MTLHVKITDPNHPDNETERVVVNLMERPKDQIVFGTWKKDETKVVKSVPEQWEMNLWLTPAQLFELSDALNEWRMRTRA